MYFQACRTVLDVKRTFNRIARDLHPDKGGTKEEFVELFDQYQEAKQQFSGILEREEAENLEQNNKKADMSKRNPSRGRWWTKLSQQELWDLIKEEQQTNHETVARQNQESLEKEHILEMNEKQGYSEKDRAFLTVDFDTVGSVGKMLVSRKSQSIESLLAEMKEKREGAPSFRAPVSLGRNKRKRTIEREQSEERKREP